MLKFRIKLMGYFIKALLLALVLSTGVLVIMCAGYVDSELQNNQVALSQTATELLHRTNLDPDEIVQTLSSADYLLHESDTDTLSEAQLEKINDGKTVSTGFFMTKSLYFLLGQTIYVVEAYPASTLLLTALLRSLFGNLLLLLFGFLIVYLLSRRIAQPIVNLMQATRELSKGNFDVAVDTHMPRFTGGIKEIAELTDNFNRMAHELKSVEYLRRDFTSNLSHELKTPVASIRGYARLLTYDGLSEEERQEYAQIIAQESARLSDLSDNLLKLTRLESQPPTHINSRYQLDEQLRRCVTALHPQMEKKNQSICVDLQRVSIAADETLLSQVWSNLLSNAIKFTPEGGQIKLTLTRAKNEVCVSVQDNGIGMTKEVRDRAFEKFYQADPSHHAGGNGLGLSLVRRIVDICKGRIEVEAKPGKGSRFVVFLPEK